METLSLKINDSPVWLVFEHLVFYKGKKLKESNAFLCYFNFALPISIPYGELVLDENDLPKLFIDKSEGLLYITDYLRKRIKA